MSEHDIAYKKALKNLRRESSRRGIMIVRGLSTLVTDNQSAVDALTELTKILNPKLSEKAYKKQAKKLAKAAVKARAKKAEKKAMKEAQKIKDEQTIAAAKRRKANAKKQKATKAKAAKAKATKTAAKAATAKTTP